MNIRKIIMLLPESEKDRLLERLVDVYAPHLWKVWAKALRKEINENHGKVQHPERARRI